LAPIIPRSAKNNNEPTATTGSKRLDGEITASTSRAGGPGADSKPIIWVARDNRDYRG
jgi:hypothetical protein